MNPNDLLFLTIPAVLLAVKLALLAFAAVLVTRNVFRSPRLSRVGMAPASAAASPRDFTA